MQLQRFAFGILLSLASFFSHAAKDDSYYSGGVVNPLTSDLASKYPMYWKEPHNVIQDLSLFDQLFVQVHGCAWSELLSNDDNNGGDESDQWYLGSMPPFGANIAYSLYGILATDATSDSATQSSACHKKTYINTFVTTTGIETWWDLLISTGVADVENEQEDDNNEDGFPYYYQYISSTCQASEDEENNNNQNQNNENGYTAYHLTSSKSQSLGCQSSSRGRHLNDFVQVEFQDSAVCYYNSQASSDTENDNEADEEIVTILDELQEMNDFIHTTGECLAIYQADQYNDQEGDQDGNALSILSYSRACTILDNLSCPDPYGLRTAYQNILNRATHTSWNRGGNQLTKVLAILGLVLASLLWLAGLILAIRTCNIQEMQNRRKHNRDEKRRRLSAMRNGDHDESYSDTLTYGDDGNISAPKGNETNSNQDVDHINQVISFHSEEDNWLVRTVSHLTTASAVSGVVEPSTAVQTKGNHCRRPRNVKHQNYSRDQRKRRFAFWKKN